ncbi:helix-turn-helix domain-containing protein [Noviherbaspirillum galbum]|uniref:Helix-turn-helix transcriptional regulator n=1 Tax=Noviherbaspirillum galbum TaxID=2709383 RepID=A0A6B3SP65_9BURK|nr:helix-turn-helix domain-containing protein [Noviherbaspirillum galbum]NEX61085.1 helix-turn-helix transcriptional regulator [Noviherbaspirillum galbum]
MTKRISSIEKNWDLPVKVNTTMEVGAVIQRSRKEQGLTQIDVAGLAGLGERFVVELEQGKETIQMQKAMNVLDLLGLEVVIRKKGAA